MPNLQSIINQRNIKTFILFLIVNLLGYAFYSAYFEANNIHFISVEVGMISLSILISIVSFIYILLVPKFKKNLEYEFVATSMIIGFNLIYFAMGSFYFGAFLFSKIINFKRVEKKENNE